VIKVSRIRLDKALKDDAKIKAFTEVEEFDGQVVQVDVGELLKMMEILKALKKGGFETIRIGVKSGEPLYFFLTKDNRFAYVLAPLR